MTQPTKGFICAATLSYAYYEAMVTMVESLKDEIPDAKIAVFTHEEWVTDQDRELFDHLFTPTPVHNRTKLWALDKTPFDITCYIDVDCHVIDPGLNDIFDELTDDCDIMMSENRPYNSKVVYFQDADQNNGVPRELHHYNDDHIALAKAGQAHKFRWHCGMFVYRKNEVTDKVWTEWVRLYRLHNETPDNSGMGKYPRSLAYWDTFAFWRLLHETDLDIKIKRLPNDAKYNFVTGYRENELKYGTKKSVLHYTIPPEYVRETTIRETGLDTTCGSFDIFK